MKLIVNDKDLSSLYSAITWSGDKKQRSRSISVSYACPIGTDLPQIEVRNGDTVALQDDSGKQRFIGIVTEVSSSLSDIKVDFTGKDILWYLGKNKVSGAFSGTPEEITRNVLSLFSISLGTFPMPSITEVKTVISTGNKTIHGVISEAYGDGYYIFADEEKVSVAAEGSEIVAVISGEGNLLDAAYSASIEAMVNRVLIVDDKGTVVQQVQEDANLSFGLMQETYKIEKDKDPATEARKLLHGEDTDSEIECVGDWNCIAGKAVYVMDTSNGMLGKFVITDDKHTFSGGIHRMTLGVEVEAMK